ncbi:transient receptor potential cation channel subfamily a member 1-like [Gigaspora margarita]|uniref:Transient receptor potential cation channel subfamily a member 1-like n=1 Tax=Gigaspora margarita TaxID=4874 RepID=A0A8H3X0M7_GIGMA|nr:transient receptor potential cation channel subfamily a member 1-like [Gigaspora margarita]
MTSYSDDSHVEIQIEDAPDKNKNKKILEIVCSPNLNHVAALHEDNHISLWSIVNQENFLANVKTIHIDNIRTTEKIFAISDNKQLSISLDRINPYNFIIFDFESDKEVSLTFPDWQKEIDFLYFIENGNIIMVNTKYYRAYVFSSKGKDNITWVCKSMIELQYFKKIYITSKGNLMIFIDTIHEIAMWDIEDLTVKTRILLEWNHILKHIEISDDEELLSVCTENKKLKETNLYVFSTETGINLSSHTIKGAIDRIHLIASQKGERLLFINFSEKRYNLVDPYYLNNPIDASKLFEHKQIQEACIIQSDTIIYTIDGKVLIEKLVRDNWVEYLRKELKDTNSITTPSKMTIDIITKIIKDSSYYTYKDEYEGKFLKWSLELSNESVKLIAIPLNSSIKKQLEILPSFKLDGKNFILHCEILENDDFITITRIGIIIWTYSKNSKNSDIKIHYYWNDWNNHLEDFVLEQKKFEDYLYGFKDWTPGRILPVSSYETIYNNLDVKFGEKELFKEFLKNSVEEEFYLTCYGKHLMKTLIELKNDKWIRHLGQSCINKCIQDNTHLISKISLLSIVFENFDKLSENHPQFIASTLSKIGFVVPSTIVNPKSTSSHLSSYGRYYQLYNTSFLDILTSSLWNHWINFQKRFQFNFQKFQISNLCDRDNNTTILAIPIPNFVSYPKKYNFWKELLLPSPNPFTYTNNVEVINEEFYRYLNGEALLKFKWNTFGRKYYLAIWAIYTVFLLSFIIAASCYNNISQTNLFILLKITICFGIWHLIFELRQFIFEPLNYMSSSWNILDLVAIISTTATSIYWIKNGSAPTWAITFSSLFLEIRFIIFLRPNRYFGVYLALIMKTVDKVISFLIIFGLFALALAHSLHLMLGSESEKSQNLNTDMYTRFGSAIVVSYYMMLTGDKNPLSSFILNENENIMIMLLMIIISFFMLIYLMNLFIGILSYLIGISDSHLAYLALKGEVFLIFILFEGFFKTLIYCLCYIDY